MARHPIASFFDSILIGLASYAFSLLAILARDGKAFVFSPVLPLAGILLAVVYLRATKYYGKRSHTRFHLEDYLDKHTMQTIAITGLILTAIGFLVPLDTWSVRISIARSWRFAFGLLILVGVAMEAGFNEYLTSSVRFWGSIALAFIAYTASIEYAMPELAFLAVFFAIIAGIDSMERNAIKKFTGKYVSVIPIFIRLLPYLLAVFQPFVALISVDSTSNTVDVDVNSIILLATVGLAISLLR